MSINSDAASRAPGVDIKAGEKGQEEARVRRRAAPKSDFCPAGAVSEESKTWLHRGLLKGRTTMELDSDAQGHQRCPATAGWHRGKAPRGKRWVLATRPF